VVGFVERSVAAGASVDALVGVVLVVFAGEWGFSALLSEDAKLFYIVLVMIILRRKRWRRTFVEDGLPLIVGALIWVTHLGGSGC
jgi:hypothetical protein